MFSGAQISLYPMSDDFIGIILQAVGALDPYRTNFRIETDDISTLIVGPPEQLFPAMRDLFVAAAQSGVHCVLSATVSRGCPGEPDDPICTPVVDAVLGLPLAERWLSKATWCLLSRRVPDFVWKSSGSPRLC